MLTSSYSFTKHKAVSQKSVDRRMIAKSSSFTYKSKPVDARQLGREIGVRYVLEGSLETDPERVRVAVQLIDTDTRAQVWSERWDRPLGEVFAVRDELVGQIAGTLLGWGGPVMADAVERRAASRRRTSKHTTTSGSQTRPTGSTRRVWSRFVRCSKGDCARPELPQRLFAARLGSS